MKNMRNLKKYALRTIVTTAILILTMGTVYSDSINITSDGKVPGKPFEYLQQQIDNLQQQIDDIQQQINSIPGLGPTRFTDMGNGKIRDNDTGLIWLKKASCKSLYGTTAGRAQWEIAMTAASVLAHGNCGLTDDSVPGDWRLPTKDEWLGLMSTVYENPALVNRVGDAKWYDGDAFIGVQFGSSLVFYWSSEKHPAGSQYAWKASLNDGSTDGILTSQWGWVWPVRDSIEP